MASATDKATAPDPFDKPKSSPDQSFNYRGRDRVFVGVFDVVKDAEGNPFELAFGSVDDVDPTTRRPAKGAIPFDGKIPGAVWDAIQAAPAYKRAIDGLIKSELLTVRPV